MDENPYRAPVSQQASGGHRTPGPSLLLRVLLVALAIPFVLTALWVAIVWVALQWFGLQDAGNPDAEMEEAPAPVGRAV
jgi:hypothetical protein